MNYADYSAVELAKDPHFQRWVLTKDQSAHTFWTRWLLEHPQKKEEVAEAIKIVELLEFDQDVERNQHFIDVWNEVYARTLAKPRTSYGRVAAVWIGLLLVGGLVFWWLKSSDDYTRHTTDQKQSFVLPDGSAVVLNQHSSLSYRVNKTGDREVQLRGEGFFNVTEQQRANQGSATFTVYTQTATVEVLGTSFGVSELDRKTQVVLSSGRVKVVSPRQEVVHLSPNEFVEVDRSSSLEKKKVNAQLYASWVDGQADFEQATLREILRWIEDRYQRPVHVDTAHVDLDLTFTATIPDGDLATLLEALTITYELDIRQRNQRIEISRQRPEHP